MFENGQSFSVLQQTCLELTSLNIKLNSLKNGAKTNDNFAYLLFDKNHQNVEVFFPFENKGIVLTKTENGNWNNGKYRLIAWKGYVLQKDGIAIYGGI